VTGIELLDVVGKYAGVGVTTLVASGVGAYFGAYLKRKAENLATHEDIDKLRQQVAAVTTVTKQIEATISNEMWRRERRAEFQLKAIESVSALTTDFLQRSIADPKYRPDVGWFSSFGVADAAIKALFDEAAYKSFKELEVLIGPELGPESQSGIVAAWKFAETRDAALKMLYGRVFDGITSQSV
jgi:hypothetical protein